MALPLKLHYSQPGPCLRPVKLRTKQPGATQSGVGISATSASGFPFPYIPGVGSPAASAISNSTSNHPQARVLTTTTTARTPSVSIYRGAVSVGAAARSATSTTRVSKCAGTTIRAAGSPYTRTSSMSRITPSARAYNLYCCRPSGLHSSSSSASGSSSESAQTSVPPEDAVHLTSVP